MPTYELVNDVTTPAGMLRVTVGETVHELHVDPNRYSLQMEIDMTTLQARQRAIEAEIRETMQALTLARIARSERTQRVADALAAGEEPPDETEDEREAAEAMRDLPGAVDRLYLAKLAVVLDMAEKAISATNPDYPRERLAECFDVEMLGEISRFFGRLGVERRNGGRRWEPVTEAPTPTAASRARSGKTR